MNTPANRRLLKLLALLLAFTLVAAACNGDDDEGSQDEVPTEDEGAPADDEADGADIEGADDVEDASEQSAITVEDQDSDGTSIHVASATVVGGPGFVVVHADDDGPGEVIGHVDIPEGTSTDVVVELDREIETGTYWPMIHVDEGEIGTYEFPGPDVPAQADGEIVVVPIEVTVT